MNLNKQIEEIIKELHDCDEGCIDTVSVKIKLKALFAEVIEEIIGEDQQVGGLQNSILIMKNKLDPMKAAYENRLRRKMRSKAKEMMK